MACARDFGASSVHFELPLSLFVTVRAREASGIVRQHTYRHSQEEQLHLTPKPNVFCSRCRLCVFIRQARASLFESQRAELPAPARVPHQNTCPVIGLLSDTATISQTPIDDRPRTDLRVRGLPRDGNTAQARIPTSRRCDRRKPCLGRIQSDRNHSLTHPLKAAIVAQRGGDHGSIRLQYRSVGWNMR